MSFDLNQLGALAAQMQQRMAEAKEEAANTEVTGQAGGGLVKVVAMGDQSIRSIAISPDAYEDREMLEDLVTAAVNDALRNSQAMLAQKMQSVTGGLPMPPGMF